MADDLSLLERMAVGEERALGELYDRHGRALYALARAIAGETADAEEVVVEAFGQAWRQAASYDARRGSVSGWLATITRTRALDLVRARGRRSKALERLGRLAGASQEAEGPDRAAERDEAGRLVAQALAELPEPQRRAIELAYFGGLSQSEIAAELGEPLGTVKTRIRAGMDKLRNLLGPLAAEGGT